MSNETEPDSAAARHPGAQPDAFGAASAQRQLEAARTLQISAERQIKKARRAVKYRDIRLRVAKWGVPGWVAGLIAGSVAAVVLPAIWIVVLGQGMPGALAGMLSGYLICGGGVYWALRPLNGERDENVVEIRKEQARLAMRRAKETMARANRASQQSRLLEAFLQNEPAKPQTQPDRQTPGGFAAMKPCPSCAATLAANADPCPRCGHKFSIQPSPILAQDGPSRGRGFLGERGTTEHTVNVAVLIAIIITVFVLPLFGGC